MRGHSCVPVAKTPCSQCRRPRFDHWSEIRLHTAQLRARMPQLKILVNYNEGPVQTNKYINTKNMIRAISELDRITGNSHIQNCTLLY